MLHSEDEARLLTTGLSSEKRVLIVWHTERDNGIRIIGARDVTTQERRVYSEKHERARRSLEQARRDQAGPTPEQKRNTLARALECGHPAGDIGKVLADIERGRGLV